MKFYLGVTDNDWYQLLSQRKPDEVNFWRPGSTPFRALDPGAPFLFKLRSPYNVIAGGGFFVRYASLPLSIVWDAFREKNGTGDQDTLLNKIQGYRRDTTDPDPVIGCIVLTQPFFFEPDAWIPVPGDWHRNLVQGKGYDTSDPTGAAVWADVQARLQDQVKHDRTASQQLSLPVPGLAETRYGEYLTRHRLGQGAFRVLVTEAYHRRCAITGERTLPILQASHIKPFNKSGPHDVRNGVLLRADVHILFDYGYMTITDDLHVEVSPRIKKDYGNGRDYYALHGQSLVSVPSTQNESPAPEFLQWHHEHIYVA